MVEKRARLIDSHELKEVCVVWAADSLKQVLEMFSSSRRSRDHSMPERGQSVCDSLSHCRRSVCCHGFGILEADRKWSGRRLS